jgi:outer membrane lipoprotein-sorting protein
MKNVAIVAAFLAVLTLGCSWFGRTSTTNGNSGNASNADTPSNIATAPSSTGVDAAPPSGDPKSDFVRASKKFLDLPQFTATMDGTGKSSVSLELEFQAPDRFHMSGVDPTTHNRSEMVMIGRDIYIQSGGRWQKIPGDSNAPIPNLREFFDQEGLKTLKDAKYDGDETLDGVPMHLYSYQSNQVNANMPYPFTSKIWVGAADGLPHKIEVTYQQGDLKTMTITYDFEKPVDIKPPA